MSSKVLFFTNSENITNYLRNSLSKVKFKIFLFCRYKKFVLGLSARLAETARLEKSEGMLRPRRPPHRPDFILRLYAR